MMKVPAFIGKTIYQLFKKVVSNEAASNPKNIEPMSSVYEIPLVDIQGKATDLSAFKGKRMLIVNTASECGYTPQYAPLEELHRTHGDRIAVLGFPCNDFGAQEPGEDAEIKSFCETRFGVSFPLFAKLHVTGSEQHPLYQWLTDAAKNGWNKQEPTWNFCKYVIDENGKLIHFLSASVDPSDPRITG